MSVDIADFVALHKSASEALSGSKPVCEVEGCTAPTTVVIERFPRDDTPHSFCGLHASEWNDRNPDAVTWQWDVR